MGAEQGGCENERVFTDIAETNWAMHVGLFGD
jgi:hypothetical protein